MARKLYYVIVMVCCMAGVRAENRLWLGNQEGYPGDPEKSIDLYATHDDPIHAFSAALRYDSESFAFKGAQFDGEGVITGEVGFEYPQALDDAVHGELIVAVLLDLMPPYDLRAIPASPVDPQLLARLIFSVEPSAWPGEYSFQLRNDLGAPNVENVFSVMGTTVNPELESGAVMLFREFTVGDTGQLDKNAKIGDGPSMIGHYVSVTPGGITFMGFNSYREKYGEILSIDGVSPTRENIINGAYKLESKYYLTLSSEDDEHVNNFIEYIRSPEGQKVIELNFIPVNE